MIYFDNAATTYPKPKSVINEVVHCLKKYCGNPGRSSHSLAMDAAMKIYETRETVADFLGVEKCENIIFTSNATYALNMVIKGSINSRCHVIASDLEHNSTLRPLYKTANEYGGKIDFFNSDIPLYESIPSLVRKDTHYLIATISSNVTGKTFDIKELSDIAQKYNLKLIIDASQYLGHRPLNLKNIHYHALCSAGHKGLYGIQGSGFAVINSDEVLETLAEGGSGTDSFSKKMPKLPPERYEAGTLSTPAIASLCAGVEYIKEYGIENISEKIEKLTHKAVDIISSVPKTKIYGAGEGIVTFNIGDLESSLVSKYLNEKNIATRSGFHCAPLIHKKLGTEKTGAVRVSLSHMNTENELILLYKALRDLEFIK